MSLHELIYAGCPTLSSTNITKTMLRNNMGDDSRNYNVLCYTERDVFHATMIMIFCSIFKLINHAKEFFFGN
jgi:hypothetical protein